jgi:hypothetical protein
LLCEQGESGQSVAAFCRDRGLRGSMFYKWKKRVEENDGAQFIEVKVAACREAVRAVPANSRAIEVRLNKGLKLVVEPGFDANHLRALLSVLEGEA